MVAIWRQHHTMAAIWRQHHTNITLISIEAKFSREIEVKLTGLSGDEKMRPPDYFCREIASDSFNLLSSPDGPMMDKMSTGAIFLEKGVAV